MGVGATVGDGVNSGGAVGSGNHPANALKENADKKQRISRAMPNFFESTLSIIENTPNEVSNNAHNDGKKEHIPKGEGEAVHRYGDLKKLNDKLKKLTNNLHIVTP